ncbi:uncharacterized protein LOC129752952 [Uranotaenia lowii]|uniref:uncharacterized protein LOC129752952 n=1 Tax=Uranotaenia lowii TaxID=190385 RepID=UPI00247B2BC6|nr:uncharacterized protein LOC129752952 [Uranotaenia lowii]
MEGKPMDNVLPDGKVGSCSACTAPDNDGMVQCDHCDTWWHYACVGVGESISERSFTCPACQKATVMDSRPEPATPRGETIVPTRALTHNSITSSKTRARLTLQRLEAEKTLREKQLDFERRDDARRREQERLEKEAQFERRQLQLEEEFMKKKLQALEDEEDAVSETRSRKSAQSGINKVEEWRKGLPPLGFQSTLREPRSQELANKAEPRGRLAHTANNRVSELSKFFQSKVPVHANSWSNQMEINRSGRKIGPSELNKDESQIVEQFKNISFVPPNGRGFNYPSELSPNRAESFSGLSKVAWANASTSAAVYDGNPQYGSIGGAPATRVDEGGSVNGANGPISFEVCPTKKQLLSRQILTKDLPIFSGNPEDWPLFIRTFRMTSEACGFDDTENLMRLQRCLKGSAYEAVCSRLMMPDAVPSIISTLETLYGKPEILIYRLLQKAKQVPAPRADKLETLVNFGLAVQNLCCHLALADQHLNNPTLLFELVEKLPPNFQMEWGMYIEKVGTADLPTFCTYLGGIVKGISNVSVNRDNMSSKPIQRTGRKDKMREQNFFGAHAEVESDSESEEVVDMRTSAGAVMSHVSNNRIADHQMKVEVERVRKNVIPVCFICRDPEHRVKNCPKFVELNVADRWRKVRELNMCSSCLNCHGSRPCKAAKQCGIDECKQKHHPSLHEKPNDGSEPKATGAVANHHHAEHTTLFRIIPVTLFGNGRSVEVFAFLDEGSSLTLVEEEVVKQLEVEGEKAPLCLQWTANIRRNEKNSKRVSLDICGNSNPGQHYKLKEVRTVKCLNLPKQTIRGQELIQKYPHLQGLPIQSYKNAIPKILIGNDNLYVAATQKIREGAIGDPIAAKCRLGWTVYGASEFGSSEAGFFHMCECEQSKSLHELVEQYLRIDSLGITATEHLESRENQRANQIMQQTTRRIADRFETGLIFKYDHFEFPDSRVMAERRLQCLERRMASDPVVAESVRRQMKEYVDKNYIHEASNEELQRADPRKTWYLPLGIVINPKKPSKIRIFCDAAAKVDGISLNSVLMKGPDLLSSLPRILFGFRERAVAICADIKEMFHQVRIRREDRDCQRLLWRENARDLPKVYIMDVATFGSTCSPCSAQYVMSLNATEHEREYPDAAEAIRTRHYMDDWLDSADTVELAVKLALEVKLVHSKGGFQLHNWLSNSTEFLKRVGASDGKEEKMLSLDCNSMERVLGMYWKPKLDVFTYRTSMQLEPLRPTKREVLRTVMSLFDPLGLLSFFVVHGKIIIQDIWRAKTDWDEKIPKEINEKWQLWANYFARLGDVRINRSYFPNCTTDQLEEVQLHIFCDASDSAYACVAYMRVKIGGRVQCSLVAGKAKVAPLKVLSIPRLELQAAVIGSRMQNSIIESHRLIISKTTFWSDSKTVLAWLNSDQRRYTKFVGVRVGEILTTTRAEDWRWIPSKLNVADDATKWGKHPNFSPESRWFRGPEFLLENEDAWPADAVSEVDTTEELQKCFVHIEEKGLRMVEWDCSSKWMRLWRAIGQVYRYYNHLRVKRTGEVPSGPLTQDELIKAEATIFRWIQQEAYPRELKELEAAQLTKTRRVQLPTSSQLFRLSPCLDAHGVIRLESRIVAASYASFDVRYPIILPSNHAGTRLLVDWYHRRFLHSNAETVVNEIRQRFHISNLRSVVNKVAKTCSHCRVKKARPAIPRMAPLPEARLQAYSRPFSFTGLDYCGPFYIKIGRALVKRWIALFTCMTIRAVHLEVVHSLNTESCKMAIRRFIVQKGSPKEIYSDNGTNFLGASNELSREIDAGNLAECFTNTDTRWIFNPPLAPHMGGVWERMVRSVKAALSAMQMTKNPDEETFRTIVREAEGIVNSRPLTFIPVDHELQEALTPNHFLMLSSNGVTQTPRRLIDDRTSHRNNWNLLNHAVDQFWKRWIREYLPTLTRRTKWFQDSKEIAPGDLVIVVNEAERNGWIRGKVVKN